MSQTTITPSQLRTPMRAAWILAAAALLLVLYLKLFSALAAGFLVYQTVRSLAPLLEQRLAHRWSRVVAVTGLATLIVGLLIVATLATIAFFKADSGTLPALTDKAQHILNDARDKLPPWIVDNLPATVENLEELARDFVGEHSKEFRTIGEDAARLCVHALIGMVIGALLALHQGPSVPQLRPFAAALLGRVDRFGAVFRRIVFAQFRISLVNTALTAFFLFGFEPILGVHLPLSKTLLVITFLAGLLPIIGNLISNTLIIIVALSVSIVGALAAVVFLVVLHKGEYFLNARIVGTQINAHAWELLLAMLVMESAFGLVGLIAAPFYYAYLKRELVDAGMI